MSSFTRRFAAIVAVSSLTVCSWAVTAKVCIDPGHGGSDPGAVSSQGGQEKTNVLNTSLKFRDKLNADTNNGGGGGSWSIVMTRTTDVYVSLQARCDIANNNGANRFMSVMNNGFNGSANGTETFSHTNGSATSQDLRNKVQFRVLNAWGLLNRGNKTYNFYVLGNTNMPAEMAELGFIDAPPDYNFVDDPVDQDSAALAHLYAIQTHYGLAAFNPATATLPTYTLDNNQAGFSASANWATSTSASDKYGTDYRWRSTAAVSDQASWSINVGTAGTYRIQAWWSASTNRAPSATYNLPDNTNVSVNQQANGGKFNVLGSRSLGTGARVTKLSCWTTTGYVVVADAVRYGP